VTPLGFVAALGPLGHDAGEVRSRAEELLSRAPFADRPPGPIRRILRFVGDAVAGFLAEVFGGLPGAGALPWILVALGTGVVAWLVWRITRGLSADRSIAEVPADTAGRTPADWHADAEAAEARGELREALRCRYAALVATLLDRGTLEDVPGRTVHELDVELATAMPGVAGEVAEAGERFDAAIYGHVEVTPQDLAVVTRASRLVADRPERARAGVQP
jgi:hypothetical protein